MAARAIHPSKPDYVAVVIGLILALGATAFLFVREGRHVAGLAALAEVETALVRLNEPQIDAAAEGALIHVSGVASTDAILRDGTVELSVNGLMLRRTVSMFQWVETRRTSTSRSASGTRRTRTTYSYSTKWTTAYHDSTTFHSPSGHENPPPPSIGSGELRAQEITLGEFVLDERFATPLSGVEPVPLSEAVRDDFVEAFDRPATLLEPGVVRIGDDPQSPEIGDLTVEYTYIPSPIDTSSSVCRPATR